MMDKSLPSLDEKQKKTQNIPLQNSLNKDFLQNARDRVRKRTSCQQLMTDNVSEPEHSLLRKFRVVARMVKNQLVWFRNLKDAEENLKTCVDEDESLVFNISAFRPDVQCFSNLTQNAKALLIKPSWMRSKSDLEYLQQFTLRLKCFERYSMFVRRQLAEVLFYHSFEKGRVIIRQGDQGFNFYFILSGSVLIEVQQEDPQTGTKHSNIMGELGPGTSFGELALLHESKRRATIVCKEDSEFLTIDKPDFETVLRLSHEMEWDTRMIILQNHPLFTDWSLNALQMVAEGSTIIEYPPNTVIVKNLSQSSETDTVFLTVKGTCQFVQKLKMLEYYDEALKERKLILPRYGELFVPERNILRKWLILRNISPGEFFGFGEGGPDTSIISDQRVECLTINKMILAKHDRKKSIVKLEKELCMLYPSRKCVFKKYIQVCKWNDYKKKVVHEALKEKQPNKHYRTVGVSL